MTEAHVSAQFYSPQGHARVSDLPGSRLPLVVAHAHAAADDEYAGLHDMPALPSVPQLGDTVSYSPTDRDDPGPSPAGGVWGFEGPASAQLASAASGASWGASTVGLTHSEYNTNKTHTYTSVIAPRDYSIRGDNTCLPPLPGSDQAEVEEPAGEEDHDRLPMFLDDIYSPPEMRVISWDTVHATSLSAMPKAEGFGVSEESFVPEVGGRSCALLSCC